MRFMERYKAILDNEENERVYQWSREVCRFAQLPKKRKMEGGEELRRFVCPCGYRIWAEDGADYGCRDCQEAALRKASFSERDAWTLVAAGTWYETISWGRGMVSRPREGEVRCG